MRPTIALAAVASAAILALTSCTNSTSTPGSGDGDDVKYVDGATFVVGENADPESLDPFNNSGFFGNYTHPISLAYDSLISHDETGQPVPLLAETWESSTTELTFILRDGITCSDGAPLTASDVAADINYVGDKKNASALMGQFVPAGTTATADDATRTVTVTSGTPDSFLLNNVGSMPIVCKSGLEDRDSLSRETHGTGLYKLVDASPGNEYTLERRTDYTWGPGDWKNNQPGLPDKIVVRVIADATTQANLLQAGDINYAVALNERDARRLDGLFKEVLPLPTGVLLFNEADGHPTGEPLVRQAVVQALTLPDVGKVIGGGEGEPSKQLGEYFVPNLCPANNTEGNIPGHDVDAANAALDEAGWVRGADGIRAKAGQRLELEMPLFGSFQPFIPAGELMTEQLKEVGIELHAHAVAPPAYGQAQSTGEFDVMMQSWAFPTPSQMVTFYTGETPTNGGNNIGDVHNEEYETLIAQAAEQPGQSGCDLWNEAERALIKALDVVPFWSNPSTQYGNGAQFSSVQFPWSIRMTAS